MDGLSSTQARTLTRAWAKCSACRQRKIKCLPQHRDWETQGQKCEFCVNHGLFCGPNRRNSEDPAVIRTVVEDANTQGTNGPAYGSAPYSTAASSSAPNIPPPTARDGIDNVGDYRMLSPDTAQASDLNEPMPVSSDEARTEKASISFSELHALCITLAFRNAPSSCQKSSPNEPYDITFLKAKIHSVFIYLFSLLLRADGIGKRDQALWILYALKSALDAYPLLQDAPRRGPLFKMALIFQKLGHPWGYQQMLEMLSNMPNPFETPPLDDPGLLPSSLSETSDIIGRVLAKSWVETTGENNMPANLRILCLHRAAQLQNGGVTSAVLAYQHPVDPLSGIFDQQRQRVASWLGVTQDSIQARVNIDERDLYSRTALFRAATSGSPQGCSALINGLADPNSRDDDGHTILEMAAAGGHLDIVKQLHGVGAELNPQLGECTSSPLQAAVDTENYNHKLVQYLLDSGAHIGLRRPYDRKNAIDIAQGRGHIALADIMRQRLSLMQSQSQSQPSIGGQNFGQNQF